VEDTQMMKRNMLAIAAVIGALALSGSVSAQKEPPPKPTSCADADLTLPKNLDKVTLCHFTGSDSNPFIINEVSQSGADSHLLNPDHHGDCGMYGDGHVVCVQ